MSLLNIISVPTSSGTKTIEIHNADITKLDFNFDILVLSAFENGYFPIPNTVLGSLKENTGITINAYAKKPLLDFKKSLNCWLSDEIKDQYFKHILCVEGINTSLSLADNSNQIFKNLFGAISLLSYKGMCSSIAMPILGTGNQMHSIDIILPKLINNAMDSLNANTTLKKIYFVEIDISKAEAIDKSINKHQNRTDDKLEQVFNDSRVEDKLEEILKKLVQIKNNNSTFQKDNPINELIAKINNKNLRFFELGILGRKLMEYLLAYHSSLNKQSHISLYEYIDELKLKNVPPWMLTYMHTLRVFGNSVAHNSSDSSIITNMNKNDIIVFTFALERFLDFCIDIEKLSFINQKS